MGNCQDRSCLKIQSNLKKNGGNNCGRSGFENHLKCDVKYLNSHSSNELRHTSDELYFFMMFAENKSKIVVKKFHQKI